VGAVWKSAADGHRRPEWCASVFGKFQGPSSRRPTCPEAALFRPASTAAARQYSPWADAASLPSPVRQIFNRKDGSKTRLKAQATGIFISSRFWSRFTLASFLCPLHRGRVWVLTLIQWGDRPARKARSRYFDTRPSWPMKQPWRNRSGPIPPCSNGAIKMPSVRRARRHRAAPLHRARVNAGVKVRGPIDPKHFRLAIDDKMLLRVLQRRLNDPRITIGPVVTIPGEQAHSAILPHHQHAASIAFHFMDPVGSSRNLGSGKCESVGRGEVATMTDDIGHMAAGATFQPEERALHMLLWKVSPSPSPWRALSHSYRCHVLKRRRAGC
jgi:hypothetical protein